MYNIYWYDDKSNNRHLVFTVDVNNEKFKWTRKIRFYAVLNNLSNFITDIGDYITDINDDFQESAHSFSTYGNSLSCLLP